MSKFADLSLTEADFKLLIDGLDALPEQGATGIILGGLMGELMIGDNPNVKEHFKKRDREHKIKAEAVREDVAILKAKVIQLKRQVLSDAAMKNANEILNK